MAAPVPFPGPPPASPGRSAAAAWAALLLSLTGVLGLLIAPGHWARLWSPPRVAGLGAKPTTLGPALRPPAVLRPGVPFPAPPGTAGRRDIRLVRRPAEQREQDLQPDEAARRPKKRVPLLVGATALVTASYAAHLPHVQAALITAKSVFAGGSESLLHAGAAHVLTEQQELLVNLAAGFFACTVSATLTYPVDTIKTRLQAKVFKRKNRGCLDLYKGLVPSLMAVCPSASLFVAMSFGLKRFLLGLSFIDSTWTVGASLLSGAICNAVLSLYRVPSDMMIKLIQTDVCATVPQALARIFQSPGALRILLAVWAITLLKTVPYGALKIGVYESYELLLGAALARWGFSKFLKSMLCGACAGVTTGLLTTPIDVIMTRLMTEVHDITNAAAARMAADNPDAPVEPVPINSYALLKRICSEIYEERGPRGFFVGAFYRACYYAPSSCSFFAVFEMLRVVFTKALSRTV